MRITQYVMLAGLMMFFVGCVSVSNKQFNLAQQSMQSGAYNQAFDQAAESLQADISNKKTIAFFPQIVQAAYARKEIEIQQARSRRDWDQAAYAYDRILAMNQTLQNIQMNLRAHGQKVQTTETDRAAINQLLAVQGRDVVRQRDEIYQKAADAHYIRANQFMTAQQYRQANAEFEQSLTFLSDYKNAVRLAAKSKHLADLADAAMYYGQAVQAAAQQQHRVAADAFRQADSFIPGFKDARGLAFKYKKLADLDDALKYYRQGEALASTQQYRLAASAFQASAGFVPGYRDAAQRVVHYTDLANQQDAASFYHKGMNFMDRDQFAEAAIAFRKANQFVPGFRDARYMADKATSFMQPYGHELKALLQASVEHGIPLAWLHDVHEGYTEDVNITHVRVLREGAFNHHGEYWPYRLQVQGSYNLELANGTEQKGLIFDTVVDYRVFRDDFGERKAKFL